MKVSEIQIIPINSKEGHVGFCQFVINDEWKFSNVAIHTRRDGSGLRLVYPTIKNNLPTVNPISQKAGRFVEKEIEGVYLGYFGNY